MKAIDEQRVLSKVTQKTAGWLLGMKNTGQLGQRSDVPRRDDGKYDVRELFRWVQGDSGKGGPGDFKSQVNERRLTLLDIDIETKRQKLGLTISKDEAVEIFAAVASHIRKSLETVGEHSPELQQVIVAGIERAGEELKKRLANGRGENNGNGRARRSD